MHRTLPVAVAASERRRNHRAVHRTEFVECAGRCPIAVARSLGRRRCRQIRDAASNANHLSIFVYDARVRVWRGVCVCVLDEETGRRRRRKEPASPRRVSGRQPDGLRGRRAGGAQIGIRCRQLTVVGRNLFVDRRRSTHIQCIHTDSQTDAGRGMDVSSRRTTCRRSTQLYRNLHCCEVANSYDE